MHSATVMRTSGRIRTSAAKHLIFTPVIPIFTMNKQIISSVPDYDVSLSLSNLISTSQVLLHASAFLRLSTSECLGKRAHGDSKLAFPLLEKLTMDNFRCSNLDTYK